LPSVRFEPATPATKLPQTYALDSAATEVGNNNNNNNNNNKGIKGYKRIERFWQTGLT
jgi:hypothetical protein